MTNDAELLSRLGAALAVAPPEPDAAAFDALAGAVRAKRIERTQALQQEARDERRRVLRGSPARRYAAIAAALAVSPVVACATTAVAGIEPPAPLRPIAELLGLDPTPASPDPASVDAPAYESQALGAPGAPVGGVADTDAPAPTVAPVTAAPASPVTTVPVAEHPHTTMPEAGTGPSSGAVPNITPGTTVPPTADDGSDPVPAPEPTPDPAPAPTPGNTPPTTGGGGPGANRGG